MRDCKTGRRVRTGVRTRLQHGSSSKQRARWRAAHTLGLLDGVLKGGTHGVLREGEHTVQDGETRGRVNVEIVLDPPGHVRLDRPDVEIIDRTVAIQASPAATFGC